MSGRKTDLNKTKSKAKSEESVKKAKAAEEKTAGQTKPATKAASAKTTESAKTAAKKPAAKSASKAEKSPEKAAETSAAPADSAKKAVRKPAAKSAPKTEKSPEKTVDKKKSPEKQTKGGTKAVAAEKEQKKAPAAKTGAKSDTKPSAKKSAKKQESAEPSSKTPHVMKLVDQKNDMINPTIMAGKSSIPRRLRGLEPLSRIIKREAEEVYGGDTETYNLTALVIEEHAPEILRRFNACDCELCVETLSRLTAEMVPARFAKLRRSTVERDLEEVRQLKDPLRRPVTSHMVRLVMQNKKRSYHD